MGYYWTVRNKERGIKIEDRGHYILYYFGSKKGEKVVGFMIKKQKNTKILDFIALSDRVVLLQIEIQYVHYTLIQVYASTESSSDTEIENFYKTLEKAMTYCNRNMIVMGDMNAKIGYPEEGEKLVMGEYGYGKRNKRGSMFIDFCLQHKLKIK